jgi:hypothetical protein
VILALDSSTVPITAAVGYSRCTSGFTVQANISNVVVYGATLTNVAVLLQSYKVCLPSPPTPYVQFIYLFYRSVTIQQSLMSTLEH